MGQRSSAEPPKRQDHQLAALDPAVRPRELLRRELGQRDDRALRDVAVAHGEVERVGVRGDELDAKREAPLR